MFLISAKNATGERFILIDPERNTILGKDTLQEWEEYFEDSEEFLTLLERSGVSYSIVNVGDTKAEALKDYTIGEYSKYVYPAISFILGIPINEETIKESGFTFIPVPVSENERSTLFSPTLENTQAN